MAQNTLPYTGMAVGVYLVLALVLIIVGFVLRHWARPETSFPEAS